MTPLLSASIALRAALMRSTASARSNSGFVLSPVKSSIERPATPVFTARATLAPTLSGSCAKPSSKSALTGISTAAQIAARWAQTSSTVTRLSALADGPGKACAGRSQRLEAEMLQGLRAADIERIGDDEASALVQFPECGAFVSSCQHGRSLTCSVCAANIVTQRLFCQTLHATTLRRNVRSSARMNLFCSANSKLAMPSLSARSRAR